jgi:hypothetical protein
VGQIIDFTLPALQWACEAEKLGRPVPQLRPEPLAIPPWEEKRAQQALVEHLRELRLVDGRGRPTLEFADLLTPLCRPSLYYVADFDFDGAMWHVVSAKYHQMAVVALTQGAQGRMREIGHGQLLEALLGELPEMDPGEGKPLRLYPADVRAEQSSALAGPPSRDVRQLEAIDELPAYSNVEISVFLDDGEQKMRTRSALGLKLTERGAYYACLTGKGRDQLLQVGPATPASIEKMLAELRRDVVPDDFRQTATTRSSPP